MSKVCCEDLRCGIDAFVDGELHPSEMLAMDRHLEGCASCAEVVSARRHMRRAVRSAVAAARPSEALRARVSAAMLEASEAAGRQADVLSVAPRMLSWRVVGPMAAAAALALVVGAASKSRLPHAQAPESFATASATSMDSVLEDLIDQHAQPLRPEVTSANDIARFDQYVGVPVRAPTLQRYQGTLIGGRVVPVRHQRAAMLQYELGNGHRVSVYVYNPRQIRIAATPRLREQLVENAPVYVGYVRGYSVAVTDKRGVGYAVASDLDEVESSRMVVAVGP
jgi:anti-sigma factor RsiW